jgi:hypothetical protein
VLLVFALSAATAGETPNAAETASVTPANCASTRLNFIVGSFRLVAGTEAGRKQPADRNIRNPRAKNAKPGASITYRIPMHLPAA